MEKIAPGKFEVTLSGETQTVVVTFGIRSEILRLITKKQLEYRTISSKNMLPKEMRAKLAELVEALDAARDSVIDLEDATAVADKAKKVEELQIAVNKLYEESILTIDANKEKITEGLAIGMIDLTDDAVAEILSLVLTKRGDDGKVCKTVTKEEILHGAAYAEDADELLSLVEAIMEYLIDALKKIQVVSQMVSSLVRPD